jgi:hypothetical protein
VQRVADRGPFFLFMEAAIRCFASEVRPDVIPYAAPAFLPLWLAQSSSTYA